MSEDFEYKVTTIKTSGYTRCGNVSTYWESKPKVIDMRQYIPIEWIETWFSQFYGEQGLEWNRCKRFMLADWEKENEID